MSRTGLRGQDLVLTLSFYDNGTLYDPYIINDVGIYDQQVAGNLIITLTPVRVSLGKYQITWSVPSNTQTATFFDEWTYKALSTLEYKIIRASFQITGSGVVVPGGPEIGLEKRIQTLENAINTLALALNKLATKAQLNSLLLIRQSEINQIKEDIETLSATGVSGGLAAHIADQFAHVQYLLKNFTENLNLNSNSIVNVNLVDGRDVSADGELLDEINDYILTSGVGGGGAGVTSFNSRTGVVVPASNDYTWAQINKSISDVRDLAAALVADYGKYLRANISTGALEWGDAPVVSDIADIASRSHTDLQDIGTNSHSTIDDHIAATGLHFLETNINHNNILNVGSNSHSAIDSHIATTGLHFLETSISHNNIQNIGINSHNQIDTFISSKAQSNGLASLDGTGKVPTAQLPSLSITDTFVVNSQVSMLALPAQTGDVAVRTDLNQNFILAGSDPTVSGDWTLLLTPPDTVLSVMGRVGNVSAESNDYTWNQIDKTVSNLSDLTTKSHSSLDSLLVDDHTQYLLTNGNRSMSGDLSLDGNNVSGIGYLDFNPTADPIWKEGRLHWHDQDKTLNLDTDISNVDIALGHVDLVRVRNVTGSSLTKGDVVYISGAIGNRPTIALADNTTELSSERVIGLVTETILDNEDGYITAFGLLRGLDTSSWDEGNLLWLSSTPGQLSNIRPSVPLHLVAVATVVVKNNSNGILFIHPQAGYQISELHDVLISGVTNNDLLQYDSVSGIWRNKTVASVLSSISLDPIIPVDGTLNVQGKLSVRAPSGASGSEQFGDLATATGINSIALGSSAQALADYSVALGQGTIANQTNVVTVGGYKEDSNYLNLLTYGDLTVHEDFVIALPYPRNITATLVAGGSATVGTWQYAISSISELGEESRISPTQTITTSGGNLSFLISWNLVTGAVGYRIYLGLGSFTRVVKTTGSVGQILVNTATPGYDVTDYTIPTRSSGTAKFIDSDASTTKGFHASTFSTSVYGSLNFPLGGMGLGMNALSNSNDIGTYWTKTNVTCTDYITPSPLGTNNRATTAAFGVGGGTLMLVLDNAALPTNRYLFSIYARGPASISSNRHTVPVTIRIGFWNGVGSTWYEYWDRTWNLEENTWQRIWSAPVPIRTSNPSTNLRVQIICSSNDTLAFWQAQLEKSTSANLLNVPSPPIYTSTTARTTPKAGLFMMGTISCQPFDNAIQHFDNCEQFGWDAQASGSRSTSVGNASRSATDGSSLGQNARANGVSSVSIGSSSLGAAQNSIAIGNNASANNNSSIAIGLSASASGNAAVIIGGSASATSHYGIGIGEAATVSFNGISLGRSTFVTANYGIAIGSAANVSTVEGIAIGKDTVGSGTNSIVIGSSASAGGFANSFAIGKNALVTAANQGQFGTAALPFNIISYGNFTTRGNVLPLTSGLYDIGSSTFPWKDIYAIETVSAKDYIVGKSSVDGIKVDQVSPTYGWRDIIGRIEPRTTGATVPTLTVYRGNIRQFAFSNSTEQEVFCEYHIPHDYVLGSDLYIHTHWSQNVIDTGNGGSPGNVKWVYEVSYAKGHDQASFSDPITASGVFTASSTQYQHLISEIQLSSSSPNSQQLDTSLIEPDGLLIMRISRNPTDGQDTLNEVPFLHTTDLHYQSTNIGTKQKSPSFYT